MNYSSNLKMTPITPHAVIHQKAKRTPSAVINPNNRCFYVFKHKYMKLQFDVPRVIPILVVPPPKKSITIMTPKKQLMIQHTLVLLITNNRVSDFRWRSAQCCCGPPHWLEVYEPYRKFPQGITRAFKQLDIVRIISLFKNCLVSCGQMNTSCKNLYY